MLTPTGLFLLQYTDTFNLRIKVKPSHQYSDQTKIKPRFIVRLEQLQYKTALDCLCPPDERAANPKKRISFKIGLQLQPNKQRPQQLTHKNTTNNSMCS